MMYGLGLSQGAAFTQDYYFAVLVDTSTTVKLAVYNRKENTSNAVTISGGGIFNGDIIGHANDVVAYDPTSTNYQMLGASHMYKNGMVNILYDTTNNTAEMAGSITVHASDGTADANMNISSSQMLPVPYDMGERGLINFVFSATGRYWGAWIETDYNSLMGAQSVTAYPLSLNNVTETDWEDYFGVGNAIRTGQADWLDLQNMKAYKVRTGSKPNGADGTPGTVSVVYEMNIVGPTSRPTLTGKYRMVSMPTLRSNEFEKAWIENGHLFVNANQNMGTQKYVIVADLGAV